MKAPQKNKNLISEIFWYRSVLYSLFFHLNYIKYKGSHTILFFPFIAYDTVQLPTLSTISYGYNAALLVLEQAS